MAICKSTWAVAVSPPAPVPKLDSASHSVGVAMQMAAAKMLCATNDVRMLTYS
jgi:hypothetical protein